MTNGLDDKQRECVLLLDEVSVRSDLVYNKSNDRIDGVVDLSQGKRTMEVASKALVFMLKGVFSSWKYVISYYATSSCLKSKYLLFYS